MLTLLEVTIMGTFDFLSSINHVDSYRIWGIYVLSILYLYFSLRKQKMTYISFLFIIVSFAGAFEYMGGIMFRFFGFFIFLLLQINVFFRKGSKPTLVSLLLLILFTISFSASVSFHGFSSPLSDLRQYIIYATPFLVFILFDKQKFNIDFNREINIIIKILNVQIIAAVLKLVFIGFNEKMVGTFTISGAGAASIFPVIYFIILWFKKKGNLVKNDWLWILSSLLVAIASNKRAVWFYFPLTISMFFIAKKRIYFNAKTIVLMSILPFIFYFGARFNPSLNPERVVWGSFDLDYIINYVMDYNLGNRSELNSRVAMGRMGSNIYYLDKLLNDYFSETNMFGYGNAEFNKYGGKDSRNISKFGFESKFMLTGWVVILLKFGTIVLFIFIFSLIYMIRTVKNNRDFFLLLFFLFSWFLFYSGIVVTNLFLLTCFIFIIYFIRYNLELKTIVESTPKVVNKGSK